MKIGKIWGLGLPGLLLCGCMSAPPAATPAVPGAAPAAPSNLYSFIIPTPEQKQACRQELCNSFLGKMLNSSMAPVGALTGGAVQPFCANANQAADLKKPPDSAEGAAARIKAEEADAKNRREAVRYLSTVDCARWPEAEEALIKALRGDRNECVRLEAAEGLQHGCCCTRQIVEALMLTVSGGEKDGFPPERSPCVQAAALEALNRCLARCDGVGAAKAPAPERPEKPTPPEKPGGPAPSEELPPPRRATEASLGYYEHMERTPGPRLLEEARRLSSRATPRESPGSKGVLGLALDAMKGPTPAAPAGPQSDEPRLFPVPDAANAAAPLPVVTPVAAPPPSEPGHAPAAGIPVISQDIWSVFYPLYPLDAPSADGEKH